VAGMPASDPRIKHTHHTTLRVSGKRGDALNHFS